ncbi:tyrosine-type recombinase/integrase [Pseudoleptotrichia goodfellowii]|jgi:recombinase, xerC/D family|uniref:Site-specific recombinase, phage integrase family n=1 Tax=Pseudoleptotrichia goodfellowii F0264 TaxID=596323 RepID=D0GNW2_9FUSO|nr:site-specific integrase [Pseudoleptotrichia goodfellowii]EEY34226.1 site-specific recombinase, phage integrase family [Pseudoleptotrichia goodfellowii F0264]DAN70589.1 MAG TPA: Integrase [Caudoviricetes sp.]
MELEVTKNRNGLIYMEYLNSCIAKNAATARTTYKTYFNNMKLFVEYLREYENNRYLLSKDTLKFIVSILERYIRFCREVKGNNAQTINNKITAISSFYIWAIKRDLIATHPFREKLDRLKVTDMEKRRKSYYLSIKEVIEINIKMELEHKKFDLQDRIIFNLIIDTACRISALQSIKIKNIDIDNGLILGIVEKEQKLVEFAIFKDTIKLIKEWLKCRNNKGIEDEYLLITKYEKEYRQMSKSTIRDRVKKIGKLIDIENLYPHSLRKTSINLLANAGSLELASEFANHSGIDVTKKHYIKKDTGSEKRNKILNVRKKAGF